MLQAMHGILADPPQIIDAEGPDGKPHKCVMVNIYYWDGRKATEDIKCKIRVFAYDDQAQHLSHYAEGDSIQFIGRFNAYTQKNNLPNFSFTIHRIDDSGTLIAATEQFFREFHSPAKRNLHDQIRHAAEHKETNEPAGKEPLEKSINQ